MKHETVYPEWVQQQRIKGTTVKKAGNTYYLYKRTSKRVPGKKYLQPVDTYLGIITPDGIIERKRQHLELKNGIASPATVSRILGSIDEEIFCLAFIEWMTGILNTKGINIAIDGKALRGSTEQSSLSWIRSMKKRMIIF